MMWRTLSRVSLTFAVWSSLGGCVTSPKAKPTRTFIARANISELTRFSDGTTCVLLVVWHVGPRGGAILPDARIRLHLRDFKALFRVEPNSQSLLGTTHNLLIDQMGSGSEMHFGNVRFPPRGFQDKIPLARPPYADPTHEIRIEQ